MDAQLATARAKLEDWVTCPSAKTPEGKAEIGKASARVESIKATIKKADETSSRTVNPDVTVVPRAQRDSGVAVVNDVSDPNDPLQQLARANPAAAPVFGNGAGTGAHLNTQA